MRSGNREAERELVGREGGRWQREGGVGGG